MKYWWNLVFLVGLVLSLMAITANAESDPWDDDDKELVRTVRATKNRASGGKNASCKYTKGQWSECNSKTNIRTRVMSLETKGASSTCEPTKIIEKKCKKACRYDKGTFSACVNNSMTRVDNLKAKSDPTCEPTREMTKRCKKDPAAKTTKKANKKAGKQ